MKLFGNFPILSNNLGTRSLSSEREGVGRLCRSCNVKERKVRKRGGNKTKALKRICLQSLAPISIKDLTLESFIENSTALDNSIEYPKFLVKGNSWARHQTHQATTEVRD